MTNLLNDTARFAASQPRRKSKAAAFNALKHLIAQLDGTPTANDVTADLALLYAHFLPSQPKTPKTAFEWVAKAMGKDDARYYLNWVYVTETEIKATDGHRLHIAPNADKLKPGYYDVQGVRVHGLDYAKFPDTDRVIPNADHNAREWYDIQRDDAETITQTTDKGKLFHIAALPTNARNTGDTDRVHLNQNYWAEALSMDSKETVRLNVGTISDTALIHLSGDRIAVIMPVRQ